MNGKLNDQLIRLSEIERFLIRIENEMRLLEKNEAIVFADERSELKKKVSSLEEELAVKNDKLSKISDGYFAGNLHLEVEYKKCQAQIEALEELLLLEYDKAQKADLAYLAHQEKLQQIKEGDRNKQLKKVRLEEQIDCYLSEKAQIYSELPVKYQNHYVEALAKFRGDPLAFYNNGCDKCGFEMPIKRAQLIGEEAIKCECGRILLSTTS